MVGGGGGEEAIQRIGRGGTLIRVRENEGMCKLQSLLQTAQHAALTNYCNADSRF